MRIERYGIRWNGPHEPTATPMDDGYWTPWHIANAEIERIRNEWGTDQAFRMAEAKTKDAEIERLREENRLINGAMAADDQRLLEAGMRVGIVDGCDTPDVMADEIIALRERCRRLVRLHRAVEACPTQKLWLASPEYRECVDHNDLEVTDE